MKNYKMKKKQKFIKEYIYYCLLIGGLCLLNSFLYSQHQNEWGFQTRTKIGFLLGHRGVMSHLPREHAFATEWGYVFRPTEKKSWHSDYKYPDLGVHFFYGGVGNTKILGNYLGFYGSIAFPFIDKETFRFSGRLGCGMAYTNKMYNPKTNPKNVAISTPLNVLIEVGMDVTKYFDNNWLTLGIDLTHFSNGSFKVPNLGLNVPYLSLAYGRFFGTKSIDDQLIEPKNRVIPINKIVVGATAIASVKDIFPTGRQKKFGVYAISVHARTFTRPKTGWEASIDFIIKNSIYDYRAEVQKESSKIPQLGVYIGYMLPLDRLHFVLGMGTYVRDFYDPEGRFYHRMGMRYCFPNGLLINVVLKSHWAKADYVEWGIGYNFLPKKKDK